GRKRDREVEKPLSGLDIEGLLSKRQKTIDPKNAIPEFKRLVHTAKGKDDFQTAAKQLADVIENRIKTSFGDQNYERAIEELGAMREELIDFDEPSIYNEIIEGLRKKIVAEELNGDRMEMLYLIRKGKLGPIDRFESEMPGAMTREEVNKVCTLSNRCV
ncbi:ATP-dependent DNA helicase II subunit 2, partial [Ascosphaera atra]